MESEIIVVIVVATALVFDFTNGFHDTANVVATSISTRAMPPRLPSATRRSSTSPARSSRSRWPPRSPTDVVEVQANSIGLLAVFGGLVGAIAWNLITWYFGLPSSSSHALIGGMVGAVFVAEGPERGSFEEGILGKVMIPAIVAPMLAFVVGGLAIVVLYRIVARLRPAPVVGGFRLGQVISGGLLALAHGTNDAQKTMGVITLALVANGTIAEDNFHVPDWVVITSATAIALGTYVGGWRIIKTMGSRIHKMDAAQGFAAQGSGATVILAASHVGFPLSTTHTISGAGDRLGRGQAALRRALGRGRQHRRRLDPDAARRRADRRAHLSGHARVRDRGRRSDRGLGRDPGRRGDALRAGARGAPPGVVPAPGSSPS